MQRFSISQTCIPSQRHTVQGFPAPRELAPNDWAFDLSKTPNPNWQQGNAIQSDCNYFTRNEPHQELKNGMFNPLTGQEPVYGHMNWRLNPLKQEQTNSHTSAYKIMGDTRVAYSMNPAQVMRAPSYHYPMNSPPNIWANRFNGSIRGK